MEMIDKGHGVFVTKCVFSNHGDHGCFWYKGCRFKFTQDCPQSILDLKSMVVYKQDLEKLSDYDYLHLKNVLNQPCGDDIFYSDLIQTWKDLNEKEFVKF